MSSALQFVEPLRNLDPAVTQPWTAPVLDGQLVSGGRRRLSDEVREEEKRVLAEAEARGHAAGMAAAKREIDAKKAALDAQCRALQSAIDALARPLAQLDDQVHAQIALLAMRIARSVVRRELRTDPTQVVGIVRDTISLLPAATRGPRVLLHPEDAALVRERIATGPDAGWSLIEDPTLSRGDCRVVTDHAQIDARIETRLGEALAALLGEERARPRGEAEA